MHALSLLTAPSPNTDLIDLPGWALTAVVLTAIAVGFAAWSLRMRNPSEGRKAHPVGAFFVGLASLFLLITAVAAAATQKFIAQLLNIGTGVGSQVIDSAQANGWPITVGGVSLFIALICGIVFLLRSKTLRSGLGLAIGFAILLYISGDTVPFVSKALDYWYQLLNFVF